LISSTVTPPFIAVYKNDIPMKMPPNQTIPITLKFKNYSATNATGVYLKLSTDGTFIFSEDSIFVGDLAPNQSGSVIFKLTSPNIIDTIGTYSFNFGGNNIDYIAKGGAIISKNGITEIPELSLIEKNDFIIIPNPSNGKSIIVFKDLTKNTSVKVFNLLGEIVYQSEIRNSKHEIDLSNQPSGTYFICVQADKETFRHKIIIQ
ncbi:MAG: T9SS type A sorting domain-containing protein, partial [Bacteroidota bacterium]